MTRLNKLFKENPWAFRFTTTIGDAYGDDICQTPIWIRPNSLLKVMPEGYIQVVGHTTTRIVTQFGPNLWIVDALPKEYMVIEDNKITVKEII